MVRDNLDIFRKYGVKKIITYCPHCFSTLKNDYRQYGADFEVIHHSQLIYMLLQRGVIKLKGRFDCSMTYHDSCYLGRYNDIYQEPREIIRKPAAGIPGGNEKARFESFCCSAGGGRVAGGKSGRPYLRGAYPEALKPRHP